VAGGERNGKLYLVGIGPGALEHMTVRAMKALEDSQVVIGYSMYLDLIQPLLGGKEVIHSAMGDETERALKALERAAGGGRVSLVSGGDPGIYGIAGPVYEALLTITPEEAQAFQTEIIPGVTAASMCASLVGTPLMQDFAVISLSDRFVPWSVIEKRLEHLLLADVALVIYEPASRHRPSHTEQAWKVISRYRGTQTPVAIVRDATRPDQSVAVTVLSRMLEHQFDMRTTVIVGSSRTLSRKDLMVTPRSFPRE
jgi:precorrin-3B C17-methyltransferase